MWVAKGWSGRSWAIAFAALVGLPAAEPAWASDYTWGGGDGLFSDALKWSPNGVPSSGDRAKFDSSSDGAVTWTGSVSNSEMQVVQTAGSRLLLDLGGNTYTLTNRFVFDSTNASSYVVVSNGVFTVPTNICEMKINAGVAPARLTFASGASATLFGLTFHRSEVSVETGAVVTFNGECKVSESQSNAVSALHVRGGSVVCNSHLKVPSDGRANATSVLSITSGSLIAKQYFSIADKGGDSSVGLLNLSGGYLETWGQIWLGNSGGARGIANVSGGRWNSKDQFEVAHREYTTAFLNMSGGEIELTTANKNFIIANAGGTPLLGLTGTVSLTGGSITLTNTAASFTIGAATNALGRCNVGGSAFLNTRFLRLGSAALAVGECVVTGGLVRTLDSISVGDVNRGVGWMRMEGGTLTNLTSAYIGNNSGSTGALELAGGFWCTSNSVVIGNNAGAVGDVVQTGGDLSANYLTVGSSGAGTYALSNGSLRTAFDITVGVNATGAVTIAGGSASVAGTVYVGKNRTGLGRLLMTGGALGASNSIRVGDSGGVGTFDLMDGSVVAGSVANSTIGNINGSSGRVTVAGGKLQYNATLYVGNTGGYGTNTLGVLAVCGGAVAVSNQLVLGNNPYAYGEVVVSNGALWVGADIWLGVSSNTCGKLTVVGGSVTNRGNFDCGRTGTGILQVAGGELVTPVLRTTPSGLTNAPEQQVSVTGGRLVVTNTFYFADANGSQARLTLAGGTFSLPKLFRSRGTASVLCDGGELEARRDEPYFIDTSLQDFMLTAKGLAVNSAGFTIATSRNLPDAPGEHGRLVKRGAGKFTLNVSATFTGPVAVEGGELALGASGLITLAGGCEVGGGALLNLSARALDFALPAGTVSHVDGELRLASAQALTVASGATLGGTGTLGRVVFEAGATLSRSAASGAALLTASPCVIPAGAAVALTGGYTAADLRNGIQLLSSASLSVAPGGGVSVTLDGVPQEHVVLSVEGNVLSVRSFDPGLILMVF